MIKIRKTTLYWSAIITCVTAYLISSTLHLKASSFCFSFLSVSVIVCAYKIVEKEKIAPKKDPSVVAFLIMLLSCFSVIARCDQLSFEYFNKLILFNLVILMLFVTYKTDANKIIEKIVLVMSQILFVLLFYNGFIIKETYGTTSLLVLGFSNSNLAGMWCFLAFAGVVWSLYVVRGVRRVIFLVEAGILVYLGILTGARSALIAMLGICACPFIPGLNKKSTRRIMTRLSIAVPIIFPVLYMYFYNQGIEFTFGGMQGKAFYSGRQYTWQFALENWIKHPVLGAYNEISFGTGMSQMHNIMVDILASYGVCVLVLVVMFLTKILRDIGEKEMTKAQNFMYYVFLMAIIQGTFEAAFFTGASGYGICCCIYLLIAKTRCA